MVLFRRATYTVVISVCLLGYSWAARADSPLTSTDFAAAYEDVPAVRVARNTHVAAGQVLTFLLGDAPTGQKAAVVNALGWNVEGQRNGSRFLEGLATARGISLEDIRLSDLTPSDRFVLGYLLAMDDYNQLSPLQPGSHEALWQATPMQLLSQAAHDLPNDFTVQFVRAIVQGQQDFDQAWCSIYVSSRQVLEQFPVAQRNLRPAAVEMAMDYLNLYQSACQTTVAQLPGGDAAAAVQPDPKLNMIYQVAGFQDQIATATQGGVVLWNPDTVKPMTIRAEPLCSNLIVWKGALWVGCQHRLIRFDGQVWKTYLHDATAAEGGFKLIPGPKGELLATHQGKLLRFDRQGDRFVNASPDLGPGQAYDILYRRNGQRWYIDFLTAIGVDQRRLPIQSEDYPGSDPRSLYEDPSGQLWVVDFKDGFYRFDERTQRFIRSPEVAEQASDLVVDRARHRTYLLHYTSGLYIKTTQAPATFLNLSSLLYMRDLYLDQDGQVWVAGWNQLVRVRQQGKAWVTQSFEL